MELRRLRYFVAVAEELHFGRAAKRLNIAQPGLSQQIRVLEGEVGARLLDRGPRGVVLTQPGEILLVESRAILRLSEEALERVRNAAEGFAGRLRVVHTRSLPEFGHEIVTEFRDAYPSVEVVVETAWTSRNVELLRARDADIAFVRLPLAAAPELETRALVRGELVVAMPSDHRLTRRRAVQREDLVDEPIVEWPRIQAPGSYDAVRREIWGDGEPRVVLEEPDAEHILTAVASGAGIALLDASRANRLLQPDVELRQLADPPVVAHGIAWLRRSESAVIARFVELASDRAPEEGSGSEGLSSTA